MIGANINDVFAYLNEKKCANHPLIQATLICLYPNCWNGPQNQSFLCYKCITNHFAKEHNGDQELSISTNLTFRKEIHQKINEIEIKSSINMKKKKDELSKILEMINEKYEDLQKHLKYEFKDLQIVVQESMESTENVKLALIPMKYIIERLQREIYIENNFENERKLKDYCMNVKELEKKLEDLIDENEIEAKFNFGIIKKKIEDINVEVKKTVTDKIKELRMYINEKWAKKENSKKKAIGLAFYDGSKE